MTSTLRRWVHVCRPSIERGRARSGGRRTSSLLRSSSRAFFRIARALVELGRRAAPTRTLCLPVRARGGYRARLEDAGEKRKSSVREEAAVGSFRFAARDARRLGSEVVLGCDRRGSSCFRLRRVRLSGCLCLTARATRSTAQKAANAPDAPHPHSPPPAFAPPGPCAACCCCCCCAAIIRCCSATTTAACPPPCPPAPRPCRHALELRADGGEAPRDGRARLVGVLRDQGRADELEDAGLGAALGLAGGVEALETQQSFFCYFMISSFIVFAVMT